MDEIAGQGEQLARTKPPLWKAVTRSALQRCSPTTRLTRCQTFRTPLRGRDALEAMAATFFKAFPDMTYEVRSVIEQGNVVVLEGATRAPSPAP